MIAGRLAVMEIFMALFGDAAPSDVIKDSSDRQFVQDVIEASKTQPVLVDFWAPWCGPCRTLTPAIEKVVKAAKGKVKLVKINIDQNPQFAGQLGVQSIPAVFAFDKGRPVDGFMGALPESQIKAFIDRLTGDGGAQLEEALAAAKESLELGDFGGAAQVYAQILQVDQANVKAIAGLARVYLATGEPEQAREVLALAGPAGDKDPDIQGVKTALELLEAAPDADETRALEAKLAQAPDDHATRMELAVAQAANGKVDAAIDNLLLILSKDREWNEGAAKVQLLKVFEAAGSAHPAVKAGRRKFSAIWFS
jgi:putative thioredoxin